jgi:hypothetical protein
VNRPMPGRRAGVVLAFVIVALAPSGCAHDRGQITPTTSGTDLRAMPRGRMTPQPFPGSSLALAKARPAPGGPAADPDAVTTSAEVASPILSAGRP